MPLLNEMARQRASIYRWFAQILYQELTEEALIHMRDDDTQARLRALKSIPELWLDVQQFQLRLRTALKRKDRQLELAADFASLFLIPPPAGVSPYAGHYPHTTSHEARKIMQQWLVRYELAPQNNEAPDHLAIQLALMEVLITKNSDTAEGLEQQSQFLKQHLLSWLPYFSQRCGQRDSFGFYATAIRVMVCFIKQDAQWIEDYLEAVKIAQTPDASHVR
ncbi:MAG: molecular chaperone TorD [Enterobacterales bacterium]|nr:molecular chaperone TorD [Enterobacterales bacterium]